MKNNLRDLIPALKNKYYFNYGGQGPLPKSSLEAIVKTWEIIQDLGPLLMICGLLFIKKY